MFFLKNLLILIKRIIYSTILFILSPFLIIFNIDFRNRFYKSIYNFSNNFFKYCPLTFIMSLVRINFLGEKLSLFKFIIVVLVFLFIIIFLKIILLESLNLIYNLLSYGWNKNNELTKEEYILSYFFSKELVLKIGKNKILKYFKLICLIFSQIILIYYSFLLNFKVKKDLSHIGFNDLNNYFNLICYSIEFFYDSFFIQYKVIYFIGLDTLIYYLLEKIKIDEKNEDEKKSQNNIEFESYLNLFGKNIDFYICLLFYSFFIILLNCSPLRIERISKNNGIVPVFNIWVGFVSYSILILFFLMNIFYTGCLIIKEIKEIQEDKINEILNN